MKGSERTYPSPGEELLSPQEIEPGIILPRHLVIIPDGDRRWAMEKGFRHQKVIGRERKRQKD